MANDQPADDVRRGTESDVRPPSGRRISIRVAIGLYVAIMLAGLAVITFRGWKVQEIDGVDKGPWPFLRPAVSYLASQRLHTGHRVREQDLLAPNVSPNLASALPDKSRLLGKYVVNPIDVGAPVMADSLLDSPSFQEAPPSKRRLRVPVGSSIVNRINAGARVWLTRGDTLIAEADVEHLLCQGQACDARLLIDSAVVSHLLRTGTPIPRLNIVLPIDEGPP